MGKLRQKVLSIAGFDPSGGAGLLADVKTFEQHRVCGFGVMTANTIQDEARVHKIYWQPVDIILEQLDCLLKKHPMQYVKIGIVENDDVFSVLKNRLVAHNPDIGIIWDPVLKSSSGFSLLSYHQNIEQLLENVLLITPNLPEFQTLFDSREAALDLSCRTSIYLKGGHDNDQPGVDHLLKNGTEMSIPGITPKVHKKHGSGCVLSSAITAQLAMGELLENACRLGKIYTERFLASDSSLLGFHNNITL